ncbi:hypothetical protein [Methanosarcina mazei]|uniref:Uncharacterized protein n=1 Tax=Methanosarcina mazei Tuc01 TaxID=1236903 RepID=M1QG49_METMZ|nr:hypothetical protein [Methanosarcina mazei]AGF95959.1 hypothetical protein MmTuc01_0534 [Methanosarcina mazei Tuc01]MDY0247573.1 hypothetical protein [Methanosarcina mazei]
MTNPLSDYTNTGMGSIRKISESRRTITPALTGKVPENMII